MRPLQLWCYIFLPCIIYDNFLFIKSTFFLCNCMYERTRDFINLAKPSISCHHYLLNLIGCLALLVLSLSFTSIYMTCGWRRNVVQMKMSKLKKDLQYYCPFAKSLKCLSPKKLTSIVVFCKTVTTIAPLEPQLKLTSTISFWTKISLFLM